MEPKVRRRHRMPFGAELTATGEVRFRLWAPAARGVEVLLADEPVQALGMEALPGGWFALTTGAARAGSRYRYRIDGKHEVPDPASRFNPHGRARPERGRRSGSLRLGRRWLARAALARGRDLRAARRHLHAEGTFAGVSAQARPLCELGVTAIELMPIADSPASAAGATTACCRSRPMRAYGTPEELKALVAAAHRARHRGDARRRLQPLRPRRQLPALLRAAVLHRAAHDALGRGHQLRRPGQPRGARLLHPQHALLARGVPLRRAAARRRARHPRRQRAAHPHRDRAAPCARGPGRERHDLSRARERRQRSALPRRSRGGRRRCDAQWNDDLHHCLHVLLTGETTATTRTTRRSRAQLLCRCLAEGFAYQGETLGATGGPRAASRARTCRRRRSSTSCRTTTRSATAPSASASPAS